MKLINLLWWRPRCRGCGGRSSIFNDGLCFDCSMAEMEHRVWRQIGEAVAKAIPILVDAWLGNPRPTVKTMVRRKRRLHEGKRQWELNELRNMAGLPEAPTVEPPKPNIDEKPGEAK